MRFRGRLRVCRPACPTPACSATAAGAGNGVRGAGVRWPAGVHDRVLDGHAGQTLHAAVPARGQPRRGDPATADHPIQASAVVGHADDDQPAAGGEQPHQAGDRVVEGGVVEDGDRADEVVAPLFEERAVEIVALQEGDGSRVPFVRQPDHLRRPVHAGHRLRPGREPGGQQAVTAADVQGGTAAGRHGVQHHRVVVDVVVPVGVVGAGHQPSRRLRRSSSSAAACRTTSR